MRTIHKYPLRVDDEQIIHMPAGAQILCIKTQFGNPCIWAFVDPDAPKMNYRVRIYGTGFKISDNDLEQFQYLGTFLVVDDTLVFHVWISGPEEAVEAVA